MERCAVKLVRANHSLMRAYVRLMPALVQRRAADLEAAAGIDTGTGTDTNVLQRAPQ